MFYTVLQTTNGGRKLTFKYEGADLEAATAMYNKLANQHRTCALRQAADKRGQWTTVLEYGSYIW